MKDILSHSLRTAVALILVTLALFAIPVAGAGWNIVSTEAEDNTINPDAGSDNSRWNTKALVNNVSSDYPGICWGSRIFAAATGPGDVFYLAYYDINRHALVLVRTDKEATTAEKVAISGRSCGVSMAINPVTGAPVVSYRARNSVPYFAHKQNEVWISEVVDFNITEGYSTSLAFDRTGTPHLAYDDGTSFSNLMYGTRNPDGDVDHGDRGSWDRRSPGKCRKDPQLRITDSGVYIAHGDGFLYESLRFSWKPAGQNWTSVTVDRGWGSTNISSITGLTGVSPTFTMGPDGVATIIYEDALNQTLMMARGPLANNTFKTSVLRSADSVDMDGWYPALVSKDSAGSSLTGGHLVFIGNRKQPLTYVDLSADPDISPTREVIAYNAATSTVTSDSTGKPHVFYLDSRFGRIKHAWPA